jgi:acyl-CoA dehydrogenase
MNVDLSQEDTEFQAEVRSFLAEKFTPDLRAASSRQAGVFAEPDLALAWHRILYEKGWIVPSWPVEYGGTGWTTMQRYIFDRECGLAGTPVLPAMGLMMCGPVLMEYGTEAQKDYFLSRIRSGEHYWCQGYSEPGAGSDLSSLQMKAVRDGDDFIVDGSKIWTTHAHAANWMFLLVRTARGERPQSGITFLLTPMDAPGLTVTPIRSMSGEHEVNQCFFDNVRVPLAHCVGGIDQGWTVAKYLLEFERGGGFTAPRLIGALARLREIADGELDSEGVALSRDMALRDRIMGLEARAIALDWTERRLMANRTVGGRAGEAKASMIKLLASELSQDIAELSLEALGPRAGIDQHHALGLNPTRTRVGPLHALLPAAAYLNSRAATIFGGSSEIQKNIIWKTAVRL